MRDRHVKKVPGFERALICAGVALYGGLAACAQRIAVEQAPSAKDFVDAAVETGYLQIEAAKLAAEKSHNLQVLRYADMMSQANARANDKAAQLALDNEFEIPAQPSRDGGELLKKLSKLDGPDFDLTYSSEMLKAQKKNLQRFQSAAESASDKTIQSFATLQLPGMRDRMRIAQTLPASNIG
jgi:predicted outer membrane protein